MIGLSATVMFDVRLGLVIFFGWLMGMTEALRVWKELLLFIRLPIWMSRLPVFGLWYIEERVGLFWFLRKGGFGGRDF